MKYNWINRTWYFIIAITIAMLLIHLNFTYAIVKGTSMEKTLSENDIVLVYKTYGNPFHSFLKVLKIIPNTFYRHRIIIFKPEKFKETLIKRCIGIENDTIDYSLNKIEINKHSNNAQLHTDYQKILKLF